MTATEFGRYTLVRRIAAGGMAEIWKAKVRGPEGFEKVLAVKKVLPDLAEQGEFIDMFVQEAKLAATLVHPNIVQVFDFGRVGPRDYFLAMEYVAGTNLSRLLYALADRDLVIPLDIAIYLAIEACKGLGYAHSATDPAGNSLRIVHRDISPHNLLVSFTGELKVADFGIAKAATVVSMTSGGEIRGKLAYMSPEQAAGGALDGRSDLFSLAIVLYELLARQRFFGADSTHQVYSKVASYAGMKEEQRALLPEKILPVMDRALAAKLEDRFRDAREFEGALTALLGTDGAMRARESTATLIRTLFSEELQVESWPDPEAIELVPGGDDGHGTSTRLSAFPLGAQAEDGTMSRARRSLRGPLAALAATILVTTAGAFAAWRASNRVAVAPSPATVPTAVALVTVAPRGTAEPAPTPAPVVAVAPRTHATASTPRPAARPRSGYLFVTARPWVEVWVDGVRLARETPLRSRELPSGKHAFRFVNGPAKFALEKSYDVPAGGNLALYVDVPAKSIELEEPVKTRSPR